MNGIRRTNHFQHRFQQRGMNCTVVMALLSHGECRLSQHGIDKLIFTKSALSEIRTDYGFDIYKMCEKLRNAYIIISRGAVLVTVARAYGRTFR
jgi:hypothetical protein